MKIKKFKLNALSSEALRQKEMDALVGGKKCTCSCYWYGQEGGSPSGTNTFANYGVGTTSTHGCNQFQYDDELGMGASGYVKAS